MNGNTISQLRYFSSKESRKFKEIKKWWKSLNWKEKIKKGIEYLI